MTLRRRHFLGLLTAPLLSPTALAQRSVDTVPLRFVIAQDEGAAPVRSEAWLRRQTREANEAFAPARLRFEPTFETAPLRQDLVTRSHRHELSPRVSGSVVNVFIIRSLADVDEDGVMRQGVHWRSRRGCNGVQGCQRHYCILARHAGPYVLGHELGHFFGNPHSPTPGNIMSYERGDGAPFFDREQQRRIRRSLRRFRENGELPGVE